MVHYYVLYKCRITSHLLVVLYDKYTFGAFAFHFELSLNSLQKQAMTEQEFFFSVLCALEKKCGHKYHFLKSKSTSIFLLKLIFKLLTCTK